MSALRPQHYGIVSTFAVIASLFCASHVDALCLNDRHPLPRTEKESSDFVIIGKIRAAIDYSSPDDPAGIAGTKYSVSVVEIFKGRPSSELVIDSENTSSRTPLTVGQKYLLFIQGTTSSGLIDSCGNSGPSNKKKKIIEELRRQQKNSQ